MSGDRVPWIHMLCGRTAYFSKNVDPNKSNPPCPNCGVVLGGWAPA